MNLKTKVYPIDSAVGDYQLGPLYFGLDCRAASPKIQELKARYEENRSLEFDRADSELKIASQQNLPKLGELHRV